MDEIKASLIDEILERNDDEEIKAFLENYVYKNDIFYEDINRKNLIQLREWIVKCREKFKEQDAKTEKYYDDLYEFTCEWFIHYLKNKERYNSYLYNKALLSLALKPITVQIAINGKMVEIKETDIMDFTVEHPHHPFSKEFLEKLGKETKEASKTYYNKVMSVFRPERKSTFKENIEKLVKHQVTNTICYEVKIYKGRYIKSFNTTSALLKEIENPNNYDAKGKEHLKKSAGESFTKGYQRLLKEYDIKPSTFDEMVSKYCERDFDKKHFVNLCFLLHLPFDKAEILLNNFGYTVNDTVREFDKIMERAFKLGFTRKMAIDLLDRKNILLGKKYGMRKNRNGKAVEAYKKMPSIEPMERKTK